MNTRIQPIHLILLLAAAVLPVALSGCGQGDAMAQVDESASVVRVETIEVPAITLTEDVEMAGSVEGFETADMYAKVSGYIGQMHVDLGDEVEKGQVLAQLFIPEFVEQLKQKEAQKKQAEASQRRAVAAVAEAKSQVTSAAALREEAQAELKEKQALVGKAEADFRRLSELGRTRAVQQEVVDAAKYALDGANAAVGTAMTREKSATALMAAATAHQKTSEEDQAIADAALEVAEADLKYVQAMTGYAFIRAPFAGAITKRMVDPGDFVHSADGNSAAKPLLQIARVDHVCVRLDIPMNRVALLDKADKAVLDRVSVLPGESFEGTVSRFSAGLNPMSRMMRVEVDLPNPKGESDERRKLRPGYYGYVTITLAVIENNVVVPSSALVVSDGEKAVFVHDKQKGKVEKRVVTTNFQDGAIVGIAYGLEAGETIVRAGGGQLSDGQEVDAKSGGWDVSSKR